MGKRVLRLRSATLGTNGGNRSGFPLRFITDIVRVALTLLLKDLGEKTFYGG